MAIRYKVLADYEVATAEDAMNYFMNQGVVECDLVADLASVPSEVNVAYVLETARLMRRNLAGTFVNAGSGATVSSTAPTSPDTGDFWINPTEKLPLPSRGYLLNGGGAVTATAWGTQLPGSSTMTLVTPRGVMASITLGAWLRLVSTGVSDVRARLVWTGATTGSTSAQIGWGHVLYMTTQTGGGNYQTSHAITVNVALGAGTTTFKVEAYKTGTTTTCEVGFPSLSICATGWADQYEAGVS